MSVRVPVRRLNNTLRRCGGAGTSARRMRCLHYAWRLHRAQRRAGVFMFRVTSMIKRNGIERGRVVGFVTHADRNAGIKQLRAEGWTGFTCFNDVNARFALQYGHTRDGKVSVNR